MEKLQRKKRIWKCALSRTVIIHWKLNIILAAAEYTNMQNQYCGSGKESLGTIKIGQKCVLFKVGSKIDVWSDNKNNSSKKTSQHS